MASYRIWGDPTPGRDESSRLSVADRCRQDASDSTTERETSVGASEEVSVGSRIGQGGLFERVQDARSHESERAEREEQYGGHHRTHREQSGIRVVLK